LPLLRHVQWDHLSPNLLSVSCLSLKAIWMTVCRASLNPHALPLRRFALRPDGNTTTMNCHIKCGPRFCHLSIYDHCNVDDPMTF
jgi:hypothetical protein